MKYRAFMWCAAVALCLVLNSGCVSRTNGSGPQGSVPDNKKRAEKPALLIKEIETESVPAKSPEQTLDPDDYKTRNQEPKPLSSFIPDKVTTRQIREQNRRVKPMPLPAPGQTVAEDEPLITLDFQNEELSNILKVVSSVMDANVVPHKTIAKQKISIYLKDITPRSALEALCKQNGYWYEENDGYIRLVSVKDFGKVSVAPDGMIETLKFKGVHLPTALMMLSEKTGQNVVCKKSASEIAVNLYASNLSFLAAVEIICKKYNLWYRYDKEKDYYILMKAADFGAEMIVDYSHKTRVINLKYASAPQVAEAVALAMGNRVRYTTPSNLKSYEHLKTEDYEDDEASIQASDNQEDLAKDIEAPKFKSTLTSDKIEALIQKRMELMMTAEEVRQINQNIGFALLSLFLRNNAIVACSTDKQLLDQIESLIARLDTPTPQVIVETKILGANLTDNFTSFFDIEFNEVDGSGTFGWLSGSPKSIGYGSAVYNFLSVDDWDINATINLLKKDGLVSTIASPLLVSSQNAEARAFVGLDDFPLVTNIEADNEYDDDGNLQAFVLKPVVEKVDIGTELKITPQINEDGSVTLRLFIEQSSISNTMPNIPYYDGYEKTLKDYAVNVVDKREVDTIITVPQGKTLALGGLVNEESSMVENKVPVLGDIPLLSYFFKDHETVKNRTETIFLITPHIIMKPEQTGSVTRDVLKEMEHKYIKENKSKLNEYENMENRLDWY